MAGTRKSSDQDSKLIHVAERKSPASLERKLPDLDKQSADRLMFPSLFWDRCFTDYLKHDSRSQASITQLSKATRQLFQPDMFKVRLAKLLQHVLYAEKDQVKKMLETAYQESKAVLDNPKTPLDLKQNTILYKLLCTIDIAANKSKRLIEGTAYRMALGAKDVSRKDHPNEGMLDLIADYIRKLPDGESIIANQRRDQKLPERKNKETKEQKTERQAAEQKYYDDIFQPLIDAIEQEEFKVKTIINIII